jgi:hypothetical protein
MQPGSTAPAVLTARGPYDMHFLSRILVPDEYSMPVLCSFI